MMKNKFVLIFIILSIIGIILPSPPMQVAKWMVLEFLAPDIRNNMKVRLMKKPSLFLLWELMSYDYLKADIAAEILGERQDKRAVPILIIGSKSPFWMTKTRALLSLGEFNDKRAIKHLICFVKDKNKGTEDYLNALYSLSKLKYVPVLPIVIDLVKNERRPSAIEMLGFLGEEETLPLLQDIAENDKDRFIREDARKAIEKIKNQPKLKKKPENKKNVS